MGVWLVGLHWFALVCLVLRLERYVFGYPTFSWWFWLYGSFPRGFLADLMMGGSLSFLFASFLDGLNSSMKSSCSGGISLSILDALFPLSPVRLTLICFLVGEPNLPLCSASRSCLFLWPTANDALGLALNLSTNMYCLFSPNFVLFVSFDCLEQEGVNLS